MRRVPIPRLAGAVAAGLLAVIAGCAPIPQGTSIPGRPVTARDTSRSHPAAAALPGQPHHAPVDSMPSTQALEVLASIPEPLKPEERVPPPRVTTPAAAESATPSVGDTSVVPADTLASDIPVPSPTPVLGERQHPLWAAGTDSAAADSARRARGETGSPAGPGPGSGPANGTGKSGSVPETEVPRTTPGPAAAHPPPAAAACWRVQVAAPVKRDEAAKKRSAAESLLLVPMVIEHDQGLWKIRTRDCFERPIADQIRARAQGSGFAGAFPFQTKH